MTLKPLAAAVLFLVLFSSCEKVEPESSDLADIDWDGSPAVLPIPGLDQVELIIDMYHSTPLVMKSKKNLYYSTFRLPTKLAANRLGVPDVYINVESLIAKNPVIIDEGKAKGQEREWIKLAYALTKHEGRTLFAAASGDERLLAATPTMVLLTASKAFVVVSFKPGTPNAQLLCALELSREFREYTNFYILHSAMIPTKNSRAIFDASTRVVSAMLKSYINSVVKDPASPDESLDPGAVESEPVEVEPSEPLGEAGPAAGEPAGGPLGEPLGL